MLLVIAATTFNAGLAFVNAHVVALTPAAAIAVEVGLVGAAHALALANFRREMLPWYGLIGVFALLAIARALATGTPDVKYLRDVLIIPTFIILGFTFDPRRLTTTIVIIHAIVLAFLLFEALDTQAYAALLHIKEYYINTRGYEAADFWNTTSDLFVSATRPDERFFSFIHLHRLSSIFLEPVSLGDYCIIVTAYVCACYKQLNVPTRIFLVGGVILAILGCDGRLAATSAVLVVVGAMLAPFLPRRSAILYLPGAVLAAFLLVHLAGFRGGPNNFSGRLAHTVDLLQQYGIGEFLGVSNQYLTTAVDSGLAYLITTQSLLGVVILWCFIVYASAEGSQEQIKFTHGICIYLVLTMMVSFSFLTIKTAAILWFAQGVLQVARRPSLVPALRPARASASVGRPELPIFGN
ncbi:MAG TPA: polysaccharide biosynthesis protein GumE [Pseudolabrys sp.]|jgi:putative polymerase|nr:polysaccharide biosynthesis protein GumE [Pseudolabrys sp.]